MADSEDREELLRGPMAERFSLWWSGSEWRSRTHTVQEMMIAQDAFAHGWKASAAAIEAAINAGIGWGHANALNQDNPVSVGDPGPRPTVESVLQNL